MIDRMLDILREEGLLGGLTNRATQAPPSEWNIEAVGNRAVKEFLKAIVKAGGGGLPHIDTAMMLAEHHLEGKVYDRLRAGMLMPASGDVLVVQGSLSGIQRFIYDVKSDGALKSLRGRSYYMILLLDAVVERILAEFGLAHTAVLYNSGGSFCLFVPAEEHTEERFEALADAIRRSVFECHGEQLVIVNAVRVGCDEARNNIGEVMGRLQRQKNNDKYAPLRGFDTEFRKKLFAPTKPKAASSEQYKEIGGQLPNTECVAVRMSPRAGRSDGINPGGLGVYYYLLGKSEVASWADAETTLIIPDMEQRVRAGVKSMRCEYMAGRGAKVQSFEELIDKDYELKRLGVLRMDVDSLGATFRRLSAKSLTEYASMSRRLDLFFKKRLNEIWTKRYSDTTVIIYSGGDDVFIAGEWSKTLELAEVIHGEFTATFADAGIGLSGGIALVTTKYPILRAAELSAREEEAAKMFEHRGAKKNALSIFGVPMRWDVEEAAVRQLSNKMAEMVLAGKLDKAFISRLLRYADNARFEGGKITTPRIIWLIDYDLSRLIKRNDKKDEVQGFVQRCINDITTGKSLDGEAIDSPYHALRLLAVAARLAEFQIRNKQ